ncbi:MAG: DUF362 domain-containing protein [Bacteriovoracaceae bacterium]|nr:DUF362 domain-containing protein [Bacteriovoracaceae bacterium]
MSKVVIKKCTSYDLELVQQTVEEGIELLGGVDRFVFDNETILLKPNLLVGEHPDKCVTTHPVVFHAVAQTIKKHSKCRIVYGDSPAIGSTQAAAKKTGLAEVADKLDIELADFQSETNVYFEQGKQNKKFTIASGVHASDGIISLPKLKTHGLERLTGCVKNQFGCVPGLLKAEFHVKLPDATDFAKMLLDLNMYLKPRLYVMDGIQAMEGNGPRGGNPKQMNILLFSDDPIALDATVCRLIDIDPEFVPTTKFGAEFGAGTYKEDEIELLGDSLADLKNQDFNIKRTPVNHYKPGPFLKFFNNHLVPKPVIINDTCTKCGLCVQMCPTAPKSIDWKNNNQKIPPQYTYNTCIRCYCCQELCPHQSITIETPLLRKFLGLFFDSLKGK